MLFLLLSSSLAFGHVDPNNERLKNIICYNQNTISETGAGVLVAIIDSGIKFPKNSVFEKNLINGKNFVNENDPLLDYDGHGSAVAAILLQLAPRVSILPLAVAQNGSSQREAMLKALSYAIHAGANIVNLSMSVDDKMLEDLANEQGFYDTLFIVAAGNSAEEYKEITKNWPNVIVVGATNLHNNDLCSYSCFGAAVDICAPAGENGDGIVTLDTFSEQKRLFNGSSAAVPVVSGLASLLKEKDPNISAAELKSLILERCTVITSNNINKGRLVNFNF